MKCPQCPVPDGFDCLGESAKSLCRLVADGQPGRAEQLVEIALGLPPSRPNGPTPQLLALAAACPDRGGVLPISMQPEHCARCGELSECRAGLGTIPGRVTLRDCLDCRMGR